MHTAQSMVSIVHMIAMSQLNPERGQSSGTIRNTYLHIYRNYLPYLGTYLHRYLHTYRYILPLNTNKTPPFWNNFKKGPRNRNMNRNMNIIMLPNYILLELFTSSKAWISYLRRYRTFGPLCLFLIQRGYCEAPRVNFDMIFFTWQINANTVK